MKLTTIAIIASIIFCVSCKKNADTDPPATPTATSQGFTPTFTGKYLVKDSIVHTTAHTSPVQHSYDTVQFNKTFVIRIDSNLKQLVHDGDTLNYSSKDDAYQRFDPWSYYQNKTIRVTGNAIHCVFTRGKTAWDYKYYYNGVLVP